MNNFQPVKAPKDTVFNTWESRAVGKGEKVLKWQRESSKQSRKCSRVNRTEPINQTQMLLRKWLEAVTPGMAHSPKNSTLTGWLVRLMKTCKKQCESKTKRPLEKREGRTSLKLFPALELSHASESLSVLFHVLPLKRPNLYTKTLAQIIYHNDSL